MKNRAFAMLLLAGIGVLILVVLLKLFLWYGQRSAPLHGSVKSDAELTTKPDDSESHSNIGIPPLDETERKRMIETEAVFYGKVLDQFGAGVPAAEIEFSRKPRQDENPGLVPSWQTKSDSSGSFTIRQAQAPDLSIGVTPPPGYYSTEESRVKHFIFYQIPMSILARRSEPDQIANRTHVADQDKPVIFKLKKMGHTEPMIYRVKSAVVKAEQDFLIGTNQTDRLRFRYWLDPNAKRIEAPHGRVMYDWGFELSIPRGGLVSRDNSASTDASSFEAPKNGYSETITSTYNVGMDFDENKPSVKREYYARFSDGTHARILIHIDSSPKRPFITIYSWFNPSGNRSTEFDTSKAIQTPPDE